jgi:hypothetical protein
MQSRGVKGSCGLSVHQQCGKNSHGSKSVISLLGERMLVGRFADKSVIMHELIPQDLKFEMEGFTQDEAVGIASLFASVIGKAQVVASNGAASGGRTHDIRCHRPAFCH